MLQIILVYFPPPSIVCKKTNPKPFQTSPRKKFKFNSVAIKFVYNLRLGRITHILYSTPSVVDDQTILLTEVRVVRSVAGEEELTVIIINCYK